MLIHLILDEREAGGGGGGGGGGAGGGEREMSGSAPTVRNPVADIFDIFYIFYMWRGTASQMIACVN